MSAIVGAVGSQIVNMVYAKKEQREQEKFADEIGKLKEEQAERLLAKIQQTQDELERQAIVGKFLSDAKIERLKDESKRYLPYVVVGGMFIGFVAFLYIKKKK